MPMRNKFFITMSFFMMVSLCFSSYIFAEDKTSIEDRAIGSAFKLLAKAFVAAVDFERFKKENITKVKKMEEEKFKKRYIKAYDIVKGLPLEIKNQYKISENMNRKQAIANIESLDKKKTYQIIDSIPDKLIAGQFKLYLSKKKQQVEKSSVVEQIKKFWNKILEKTNASNLIVSYLFFSIELI